MVEGERLRENVDVFDGGYADELSFAEAFFPLRFPVVCIFGPRTCRQEIILPAQPSDTFSDSQLLEERQEIVLVSCHSETL